MALPEVRADRGVAQRDPLLPFERFVRQFDDAFGAWPAVFDRFFGDAFTPFADVEETDDAYVVEIELPGVKKDDVHIELAGRRLTVSGERKERERAGVLRRRTRTVGRFHYEVTLPGDLDDEHVDAELTEGVLTVRVPKAATARPRRIEVH